MQIQIKPPIERRMKYILPLESLAPTPYPRMVKGMEEFSHRGAEDLLDMRLDKF
jgi:hypothetical protein